jgi:RHS repeat-associated protein
VTRVQKCLVATIALFFVSIGAWALGLGGGPPALVAGGPSSSTPVDSDPAKAITDPCYCPPGNVCPFRPEILAPYQGRQFTVGTPVVALGRMCRPESAPNLEFRVACGDVVQSGVDSVQGTSYRKQFNGLPLGQCTLEFLGNGTAAVNPVTFTVVSGQAPDPCACTPPEINCQNVTRAVINVPSSGQVIPANHPVVASATICGGPVPASQYSTDYSLTCGAFVSSASGLQSSPGIFAASISGAPQGACTLRFVARPPSTLAAKAGDAIQAIPVPLQISASNNPPSVQLIRPQTSATPFLLPGSIVLEATATDIDAGDSVTVQFLVDGLPVGPELAAPYRFEWAPTAPRNTRNLVVSARARDSRGGTSTSTAANIVIATNSAPTVTLSVDNTWPALSPGQVILNASANDPDGAISRIQILANGVVIGEARASTYRFTWTNPPVGTHNLIARAFDTQPIEGVGDSVSRTLTVAVNAAPTAVELQYPDPGPNCNDTTEAYPFNQFLGPAAGPLTIQARFADPNGDIRRVEFFRFQPQVIDLLQGSLQEPEIHRLMVAGVSSHPATQRIAVVSAAGPNETVFTARINVSTLPVSPAVQGVYAIAYDSGDQKIDVSGAAGTPAWGACPGISQPWTYWRWAPIAVRPDEPLPSQRTPCGGSSGACTTSRHSVPGFIEAERYDQGGQGVGYFEADPYTRPGTGADISNPRGDDVDLRQCSGALGPSCTVSRARRGEWLKYSMQFAPGPTARYLLYGCLKPRARAQTSSVAAPLPEDFEIQVNAIGEDGNPFLSRAVQLKRLDQIELASRSAATAAVANTPCADAAAQYLTATDIGAFPGGFRTTMQFTFKGTARAEFEQGSLELDRWHILPSDSVTPFRVRLDRPRTGDVLAAGSTMQLAATVTGGSDTNSTVAFTVLKPSSLIWEPIATISSAPGQTPPFSGFVATYPPPPPAPQLTAGVYSFRAVATSGSNTAEEIQTVQVSNNPGNQAPIVSMVAPANGSTVPLGTAVQLRAEVRDPDGSAISQVQFTRNGVAFLTAVREGSTDRYVANWTPSWDPNNPATHPDQPGTYRIGAIATDNGSPAATGSTPQDAAVLVTVVPAGTIDAEEMPVAVPATVNAASDGVGSSVGEFHVDESGAATYTMPITAVPGRAGVTPEISLSYSSLGGNGPAGRGWSIAGASLITRCRQTVEHGDFAPTDQAGNAPPIRFDNTDRFCLDGQRLLVVGSCGETCTEYRTEIDTFTRVRAYVASKSDTVGPKYFVAQRKDGTTAWYGDRISTTGLPFMAAATDITRPDGYLERNQYGATLANAPAIAWALVRNMDSAGNYVDFEWNKLPLSGEQVLAAVRYTGKVQLAGQATNVAPAVLSTFASVQFVYDTISAESEGYVSGSRVAATQRLRHIRSYEATRSVRNYRLRYNDDVPSPSGSGARILTEVVECSDSTESTCFRATQFGWSTASNTLIPDARIDDPGGSDMAKYVGSKLGDVDGDGLLDLVWFDDVPSTDVCPQHIKVRYGQLRSDGRFVLMPASGTGADFNCSMRPIAEQLGDAWHLIDFNGDGRDDLMLATSPSAASGAPRWVIYPSRGRIRATFDEAIDLLASCGTPTSPCLPAPSEFALAQLADFDGDGLVDVIYGERESGQTNDTPFIRLMERDGNGSFKFSQRYRLDLSSAFGQVCQRNPPLNRPIPATAIFIGCNVRFTAGSATTGRSPRPVDFNGDGRADLLLTVDATYEIGNSRAGQPSVRLAYVAPVESAPPSTFGSGNNNTRVDSYFFQIALDTVVRPAAGQDGVVRFANFGVQPRFTGVSAIELQSAQVADANGDGLQDLFIYPVRLIGSDQIRVHINRGDGFAPPTTLTGISERDSTNLVDVNGDGRADIVHPSGSTSAGLRWRTASSAGSYSTGTSVTLPGGPSGFDTCHWLQFFADFDADGAVDFVGRKYRNGSDCMPGDSESNFDSSRSAQSSRYRPRDVITAITNGYGAQTTIRYQPLTNGAVYRRDAGARLDTSYGRGSAVADLLAPVYVVSAATSPSPGAVRFDQPFDPSATSTVYYRYRGAKVQAGGRGMLGFREVQTIDPNFFPRAESPGAPTGDNGHAVTISRYLQRFPLIGLPSETMRHYLSASFAPGPCLLGTPEDAARAATPVNCFTASVASAPEFEPSGGQLLSYAKNTYATATGDGVGTSNAVFPYISGTFEATFDTASVSPVSTSETTSLFATDGYGNTPSSGVGIASGASYANLAAVQAEANARLAAGAGSSISEVGLLAACGGTRCAKYTRTTAVFSNDATDYWRLSRMTSTTVRHARPGAKREGVVDRSTAFEYDLGSAARTGILKREIVQPGVAGEEMSTAYVLDDFGNQLATLTCSGDIAATSCDGLDDLANGFRQRPAGNSDAPLSRVFRYVRNEYDDNKRYLKETRAPYYAVGGTNQANEVATSTVVARDDLGNITNVSDLNGVGTVSTYGALGRLQRSVSTLGAEAVSEFHWCGSNAAAQQLPCPLGAVFRKTDYAKGGASSVTYFDKLGRAFFSMAEAFNPGDNDASNDWTGKCSIHDRRARVVRVSEPFFVTNAGSTVPGVAAGTDPCALSGRYWTRTEYDYADRPTSIQMPEHALGAPAFTRYDYAGLTTATTAYVVRGVGGQAPQAQQLTRTEAVDATGVMVSTVDGQGLQATYAYNATDNLISVTRRAHAQRNEIISTIGYDGLGRKLWQDDPDAGRQDYRYNAAGELICSSDARFHHITDYDALGRAWRKWSRPGACPASTTSQVHLSDVLATLPPLRGNSSSVDLTIFDSVAGGLGLPGKVQRLQTTDSASPTANYQDVDEYQETYLYDAGRPTRKTTLIYPITAGSGETYVETTLYDTIGRVKSVTQAGGGTVENMYAANGFLRRIRNGGQPTEVYWELLGTDARGQAVRERRHANVALSTRRDYDAASGRLRTIRSGLQSGDAIIAGLQDLEYEFDSLGNLLARRDRRTSAAVEERFEYDTLNRLVKGELRPLSGNGASTQTIALQYDKLGNICAKNNQAYTYAGAAGCGLDGLSGSGSNAKGSPHAVTGRSGSAGSFQYGYDVAGNQVSMVAPQAAQNRAIRYNADGLADRITTGSNASISQFRYGPSGRYLRTDTDGATTTYTRYVGSVEIVTRGSTVERKRYIGGFLILTETGSGSSPARQFRYVLTDHLGSLDTLVDETGVVRERLSFDAHGSRRVADAAGLWITPVINYTPTHTTRGFTGHEHVDKAGIVHMNGRLYDPVLGRMLSADPIVQEPYNAQNLNRYTYVLNNPLSYTDPSGLSFVKKYWRTIASIAINMFLPWAGLFGANLFINVVASGFIAGVVGSGSLQGGLIGAFSAAMFFGIGARFEAVARVNAGEVVQGTRSFGSLMKNGLTAGQTAAKVLAHGMAGGITQTLSGGKFGSGFAGAGFAQAFAPVVDGIGGGKPSAAPARILAASLVGGTASRLSGGKFATGAVTAAFARAYNDEKHANDARAQRIESAARQVRSAIRQSVQTNPDAAVQLSLRDFGVLVESAWLQAEAAGFGSMSYWEFRTGEDGAQWADSNWLVYADTVFEISGLPGPYSGRHLGADLNYMYQGMAWSLAGASLAEARGAVVAHNAWQLVTGEGYRNVPQIPHAQRWLEFGYRYASRSGGTP